VYTGDNEISLTVNGAVE